jgi:anti-sigma regulatory factor (Ser/Thr protein kinase)
VLSFATIRRERRRINQCMVRRESTFHLDNDPDLIMALLSLIQEELEGINFCDATGLLQVGIALQEAMTNALFHGNLELSSQLRQDDERIYEDLAESRRTEEPYCLRKIRVDVQLDRDAVRFVIGDEGPGFDTEIFARPVEPGDLSRIGGRGLLLIRTFMDQVRFNSIGNRITMIKNRPKPAAGNEPDA